MTKIADCKPSHFSWKEKTLNIRNAKEANTWESKHVWLIIRDLAKAIRTISVPPPPPPASPFIRTFRLLTFRISVGLPLLLRPILLFGTRDYVFISPLLLYSEPKKTQNPHYVHPLIPYPPFTLTALLQVSGYGLLTVNEENSV